MDEGVCAQAQFAYQAHESDELSLTVGAIIRNCIQKEDGWMEGELNGSRGMFPDNFIKIIQKTKGPPPPASKPKKDVRLYITVYPYDAVNLDELTFKDGQIIEFIEDLEDGWATGKLVASGAIGHYPTNFVELSKSQPIHIQPQAVPNEKPQDEYYKAAFEYKADNKDELDLSIGDVIKIISKDTADDGWWEGEINGRRGVFPKNFVDSTPISQPKPAAVKAETKPDMSRKNKTVVLREKKTDVPQQRPLTDFATSTNFSKDANLIDNSHVKSRPKGPRNKRPPNAANRRINVEQCASPLEENPPMEQTKQESPEKPKPAPTITSSTTAPGVGVKSPTGAFAMPGISNINMNSLKKKQKQFSGVTPSEPKIKEEELTVPPWKQQLLTNRSRKEAKTAAIPGEKTTEKNKNLRSCSFKRDERDNDDPPPAPWVKELKEKKNFSKQGEENTKPAATTRSKESINRSNKSSPFSQCSPASTPSVQPTTAPTVTTSPPTQVIAPPAPTVHPQSNLSPPSVKAATRTSTKKQDIPQEPTIALLAQEIKLLQSQVQILSLRLDDETEARKTLENKIRSMEYR